MVSNHPTCINKKEGIMKTDRVLSKPYFSKILLIAFFLGLYSTSQASVNTISSPEQGEYVATKESAYWWSKGSICATYGNDKGAIRYFKKAIELDPKNSGAYFQMGISYGELSEYEKAIFHINKAIDLMPDNGLYYYGKGRVYLLTGDINNAIKEITTAARMGNTDAINYLSKRSPSSI